MLKARLRHDVPLPAPVLAELRRLWKTHRDKRWLCPSPTGKGPITRHAFGHASIGTTALYTHLTEPTRAGLKTILDKLMAGL